MKAETVKLINEEFVLLSGGFGNGKVMTAGGKEVAPKFNAGSYPDGPDAKNNPLAPDRLRTVLKKFQELPPEDRKPPESKVANWLKAPGYVVPTPPKGGLVLRETLRRFYRDPSGKLSPDCKENDFLWMTEAEWRSLVPKEPKQGDSFPAPRFLLSRIGNHHMDLVRSSIATRLSGTPQPFTMTVLDVTDDKLSLGLTGSFQVVHNEKFATMECRAYGHLVYDRKKQTLSRCDIAVWADITPFNVGNLTPPKGHALVGAVYFELSPGGDRLPPGRAAVGGLEYKNLPYFE